MSKALVSLSGGRDSLVALAFAIKEHGAENVRTISFDYGSKHPQELIAARAIAEHYMIPWKLITIDPSIFEGSTSTLLAGGPEIERGATYDQIIARDGEGQVDTYIPGRNLLFSAYANSIAESMAQQSHCDVFVYLGQHADDACGSAYPDCTPEFVKAVTEASHVSSEGRVTFVSPFINMHKCDIIKLGYELGAPMSMGFSCYDPVDTGDGWIECGNCATDLDVRKNYEKLDIAYTPTFIPRDAL